MTDFFALSAKEQTDRLSNLAINALKEWGIEDCQPRLIKYRENAVYEVLSPDGKPAALRVHRHGYHSAESLASELQWMAMLSENGLLVPTPIATSAGELIIEASAEGVPGAWKVDMLSWLDGKELGAAGEALDFRGADAGTLFYSIGQAAAKLHNLTVAWPQQNSMKRHTWDRDGFVGEQPLWGPFWVLPELNAQQRDLFLRSKEAIATDLDIYGKTCDNYGMIHADLVPDNVMIEGELIKVIDFDDAGFGWHMFEIVTAIYWLTEEPEFETIKAQLLAGYQSRRPLAQRDLDTMQLFFAARSLTYLGWVHDRRNTDTAMELTPIMIEIAEKVCNDYLSNRHKP